jgi:hypothetical protein
MALAAVVLAALGLVLNLLLFVLVVIASKKIVNLEERIAWFEGQQGEIESATKSEPEVPEILKAGATQPPGSA